MIEKSLFSFFNILRENRQFIFNVIFPEEASWAALNPSVENEPLVGHLCYSGLDFNSLIIVFLLSESCIHYILYECSLVLGAVILPPCITACSLVVSRIPAKRRIE